MKMTLVLLAAVLPLLLAGAPPLAAGEAPDYAAWNALLARYYDPARGMDYRGLKAKDAGALADLRRRMAAVDVKPLAAKDQLAYWINLYNISVVGIVVDHYPVKSVRDISTDPIIRMNVFKKPSVQVKGGATSLDDIENVKIREGFKDPRIHFAINCAAASCPPIRPEAYVGARIDEQLDDQARRFLNDPRLGVKVDKDGDTVVLHVTKILDWFADDFEKWPLAGQAAAPAIGGTPGRSGSGGSGETARVAFVRKYLPPDKQQLIAGAKGKVKLDFYPYDWKLNAASRAG
jgi:hypothetical protein